ncbi:uncharacterized protein B0T15DRAFT_525137 [Chaetomium strumarium]|uniref:Uncharacterized protein n=1 Tax=Chaetomium strumarium TaxID=1170767 RepID=A0AAJ0GYY5_9PEZI|nr:hypothetical protein B0T15DRAFT_525137 [Chaetomium strumarium]
MRSRRDLGSTLTIVMFLPLACFSERARCVHIEMGVMARRRLFAFFFFFFFATSFLVTTSSHRQKWISRFSSLVGSAARIRLGGLRSREISGGCFKSSRDGLVIFRRLRTGSRFDGA